MSNSYDPGQIRHFVEPDLVPTYLQRLSAEERQNVEKASGIRPFFSHLSL